MKLNLALVVKLAATLFHNLVVLLSKDPALLAFSERVPAEGVESVPQGLGCQPNRPWDLVSLYGRGEEWLVSLGLALKDLLPDLVSETRLVVCLFVKVKIQQLFLPARRRRPILRLVV
jgi:hypothetical protein